LHREWTTVQLLIHHGTCGSQAVDAGRLLLAVQAARLLQAASPTEATFAAPFFDPARPGQGRLFRSSVSPPSSGRTVNQSLVVSPRGGCRDRSRRPPRWRNVLAAGLRIAVFVNASLPDADPERGERLRFLRRHLVLSTFRKPR